VDETATGSANFLFSGSLMFRVRGADGAWVRGLLLFGIALTACALPAAGPSAPILPGAPVFAITGGMGDARISERDPRTLGQRGAAISLGKWEFVSGLSPDGSLVAATAMNASPRSIRFLDVVRKRWRGSAVQLPTLGAGAVRWTGERTAVVLGERPDGLRAVFVDADRRRIVRTVRIPGHLEAQYAEPTPAGMALLLNPLTRRQLGPVLVGVIRPSGAVKVVEVARIVSGSAERPRRPALIADATTSRAYVFGGLDEPVAEIDLRTMAVTYHTLRGVSPLAGTLGSDRHGTWVGPGRIAIVGFDDARTATLRLGLSLIDTSTWQLRRIDRASDFMAKSGELLLGLRPDASLAVFGVDGRRRFTLAEQVFQVGAVAANGQYVYAYNLAPGSKGTALVVDARAGAISSWPHAPPFGSLLSPGFVLPGA
jgi:hypothetical protein